MDIIQIDFWLIVAIVLGTFLIGVFIGLLLPFSLMVLIVPDQQLVRKPKMPIDQARGA